MKRMLTAIFLLFLFAAACGDTGYDAGKAPTDFYGPTEMAVEPSPLKDKGAFLFVINSAGGNMTIVNTLGFDVIRKHSFNPYEEEAIWLGRAPLDTAITPTGDLVYVTDTWADNLRTVDPVYPYNVNKLEPVLRAARISIVPVSYDLTTFATIIPEAWDERHEVWLTDPDNSRLQVWDHAAMALVDQVDLPSPPEELQVSRDGNRVFVLSEDATLRVVDAQRRELTTIEIFLGGKPHRLAESADGDLLMVLNIDPPQLHLIDTDTWSETDDEITFPMALNGIDVSTDGRLAFISSDDGMIYYFFIKARRACGSNYENVFFYDEGVRSNPTIARIETKDCVTREEEWTITYDQEEDAWEVRGSSSGLQVTLAYTDQAYESDKGHLRFTIRQGTRHVSDGDHFKLNTIVGVAPIPVGKIPTAVLAFPYQNELEEDLVFVANSGSQTISRIYTGEDENLGAVQ